MWTRRELKRQAKAALKRDYWRILLVTTLVLALLGGVGSATVAGTTAISAASAGDSSVWSSVYDFLYEQMPFVLTVIKVVAAVAMVAVLASLAEIILLVNPVEVGFAAFRTNALRSKGKVGDLGHGFDVSYKRNVGTMFTVALYTALWSLLFAVPGIIKTYEYSMIPYLLADHPEMTRREAFAASKAMMKGNKWKAFVLDLSFILWRLLGTLTFGIVTVLYVRPYRQLTNAALYEKLKALHEPSAAETFELDA